MFFTKPTWDALIILVVLLLFVGPKRLPQLSRSIGESIKEFKGGIADATKDKELDASPRPAQSTEPARSTEPAPERDTVA